MARQVTRWRPDTCGCVVDFEWDSDVPEADRALVCVALEPCSEHPASGDLAADFQAVQEHNRAAHAEG